jgi:hypothetical protein
VFAFYAAKPGVTYDSFEAVVRNTPTRPHDGGYALGLPEGDHQRGVMTPRTGSWRLNAVARSCPESILRDGGETLTVTRTAAEKAA